VTSALASRSVDGSRDVSEQSDGRGSRLDRNCRTTSLTRVCCSSRCHFRYPPDRPTSRGYTSRPATISTTRRRLTSCPLTASLWLTEILCYVNLGLATSLRRLGSACLKVFIIYSLCNTTDSHKTVAINLDILCNPFKL